MIIQTNTESRLQNKQGRTYVRGEHRTCWRAMSRAADVLGTYDAVYATGLEQTYNAQVLDELVAAWHRRGVKDGKEPKWIRSTLLAACRIFRFPEATRNSMKLLVLDGLSCSTTTEERKSEKKSLTRAIKRITGDADLLAIAMKYKPMVTYREVEESGGEELVVEAGGNR